MERFVSLITNESFARKKSEGNMISEVIASYGGWIAIEELPYTYWNLEIFCEI